MLQAWSISVWTQHVGGAQGPHLVMAATVDGAALHKEMG